MVDIGHNHFVFGNSKEIEEYKKIREAGVPVKSITILSDEELANQETTVGDATIDEEILKNTPIHDTGALWLTVLCFFLPVLGLILMAIFKKKHYARNFRRAKAGTITGFIFLGALIVLFLLALLYALK
jgi:oligopeptide transport system ATP-binding protein